jgi:predicted ester cyclase
MRIVFFTAAALMVSALPAGAATVDDATAVRMAAPETLIVSGDLDADERVGILKPVDAFYGFWTNGSKALLDAAISSHFVDHTLPPGRPQGPTGPIAASRTFLAAVPDLKVAVVQRIVVQDRVVSHLRFTGHFTGTFHGTPGRGQAVDFIATDILRVAQGKITDNWHLEDNLTFLTQIGMAQIGAVPGH